MIIYKCEGQKTWKFKIYCIDKVTSDLDTPEKIAEEN